MKWFRQSKNPETTQTSLLPEILINSLNTLPIHSALLDDKNKLLFKSKKFDSLNISKEDRLTNDELLALVRVARKSSESSTGEFSIKRSALGEVQLDIWGQAKVIDQIGTILLIIDDESERSRIDAVRRDFITNISHELKTPITALGLNSDALMISLNDKEKVVDFAKKIKAQAQRLADLVQEIIYLSRLQDTDPNSSSAIIQLSDVVREAIDLSETIARVRNIEVNFSATKDIAVRGIRDQLVTAVLNLIENAINYSADGTKVDVAIETRSDDKLRQNVAEIIVKDQGIGIPEPELDRIFERFYRVDPARSRSTGGTGLGLSIVKHVAQNHGGEIKVWSTPGIGSTFTFRIPISEKAESNQ